MTGSVPGAAPLEPPRPWTEALIGAHRGVLASLEARTVSRPTGQYNAKGDAVYAADLAAEHAAIAELHRYSKPLRLVSEESGELQPAENGVRHRVVIDPIDGSTRPDNCRSRHSVSRCFRSRRRFTRTRSRLPSSGLSTVANLGWSPVRMRQGGARNLFLRPA